MGQICNGALNCRPALGLKPRKLVFKWHPTPVFKWGAFQCKWFLHYISMIHCIVSQWARRSNQSILKEISPGCSLEGLMLKLKLQYFGHLMQSADSLEKTLMLGGIRGRRRRGDRGWDSWMASLTRRTWVWVNSGSWWWTGRPGVLRFMGSQRVGHDWVTELNWKSLWMVTAAIKLKGTFKCF